MLLAMVSYTESSLMLLGRRRRRQGEDDNDTTANGGKNYIAQGTTLIFRDKSTLTKNRLAMIISTRPRRS